MANNIGAQGFTLKVEGLSIVGEVHIPIEAIKAPALILCHGIPAATPDLSDRGYPLLADGFAQQGFITFIFNFRGAGLSGGNFDILGWARDLKGVLDYALSRKGADPQRLALVGFSAGAAVALFVAAQEPGISAVVALACPLQFREEGAVPLLEHARRVGIIRDPGFPPSVEEWWSGFLQVSPIRWIDKISPRPVFLIYGEKDELIPLSHARSLFERAKEPKEMVVIPEAGHRLRRDERATALVMNWLKGWVRHI